MSEQSKKHWKEFFDYKYLGSQDLDPGQDLAVKIVRFDQEQHTVLKGEEKEFLVVYFEGIEKGMIFNKTNCRIVGPMLGSNYPEDWVGKSIALYIETGIKNPSGGAPVEALRIRGTVPKETASQKIARMSNEAALAIGRLIENAALCDLVTEDERAKISTILRANWIGNNSWRKIIVDKHIAGELSLTFLKNYLLDDKTTK
jgi:hypothetical protein